MLIGEREGAGAVATASGIDDGATPYVHLPITRQPEITLCEQLQTQCVEALGLEVHGMCRRFGELFRILMKESTKRRTTDPLYSSENVYRRSFVSLVKTGTGIDVDN